MKNVFRNDPFPYQCEYCAYIFMRLIFVAIYRQNIFYTTKISTFTVVWDPLNVNLLQVHIVERHSDVLYFPHMNLQRVARGAVWEEVCWECAVKWQFSLQCSFFYLSIISGVGDRVVAVPELWIDLRMENPWTLTLISVTFLMVLRAETTAMD